MVLESLKKKIGGFDIEIKKVEKSGIMATDFDVILEHDNHDHDMDYLYGHDAEHFHSHEHTHTQDHPHPHEHTHESHDTQDHPHPHEHTHVHRSLGDVTEIINSAGMTDSARKLAIKVFSIVAEAEASVHGRSIEEVHFHEVGAGTCCPEDSRADGCADLYHIPPG